MPNSQKNQSSGFNIWNLVHRYFSPEEAWGDPWKISGILLMVLFQIRFFSSWPAVIHCGTQGKHCKGSYHPKGLAADFHFKPPNGSVIFSEQIKLLLPFLDEMQFSNFIGLGVYPCWHHPGFHLDVRGYRARWGRVNGEYCSLTRAVEFAESLENA